MIQRITPDYRDGWNCLVRGVNLEGRFRSLEAERGYRAAERAVIEDRIMFEPDESEDAPPVLQIAIEMLEECHHTFENYAEIHFDKGTEDGINKGKANLYMAGRIRGVIDSL